jgi:hypothetical protein
MFVPKSRMNANGDWETRAKDLIAYSPYYKGLMVWRSGFGCSSFNEQEYESESEAKFDLEWWAREWDAQIVPAGSLDNWPEG